MGYITRTCPTCEGEGEVSNIEVLKVSSEAPKTRAKRVPREVNDPRSMAPVVTMETLAGV